MAELKYDLRSLPFSITILKLNNEGSSGINFGGKGIEIFAVLSKPTLTIHRNGAIRIIPKKNNKVKLVMLFVRSVFLELSLFFISYPSPSYNSIFDTFRLKNVNMSIIINMTYEIGRASCRERE